ncbi:bifunctional diaminohydroxyphosphoribosylaminopyrimidine deaminase/5-amino-6-(5-phosphoribosylamino)uracil reductase RibD [Buchnera aphidicola (Thelaxes californica)]|uniref:Riboflavin biosynthesis protein RibD n=1 Tax=Buchnera aphidicola (Thelaxes californica) TaxID=1315998 RepID=A0A4D6YA37_9GAMM|nr:bifunctional diaminohydroxyphosphoribosylaminopyrimidine deaminase/5-amino-6-(5-phosphoribosylamino)uracil reductase RibD [Buchnera aphidicola]QCI26876.1 bifunctional diaminohydroxyphosphoribosylaminopyrimidine deaminase/5-amino-6-(5-phosphoribosylamino)uracil reductase RibD [Buchnera aphidicola (Thelaxes californica)]
MNQDIYYMQQAINLSKKGKYTTPPNPNVGCIIIKNKKIIGVGWHQYAGCEHAEIIALKEAGQEAKGAIMYVTLEPCIHFGLTPPCCKEIIKSKISQVIIGSLDPNPIVSGKGVTILKKHGIQVKIGILNNKIESINKGFFKRMKTGIPYIKLKLGISLDGRIATQTGESKWITSENSRNDVQLFRAQSCAILSSSNTIISDNPYLTVRNKNIKKKNKKDILKNSQPLKIIIDSRNLVQKHHNCIINTGKIILARIKNDNQIWPKNVEQVIFPKSTIYKDKIDIKSIFYYLGKKNINNVWVETGGTLSGILLSNYLIDELIIYIAPILLGENAKPMCILNNITTLSESLKFSIIKIDMINSDIRIIMKPKK